MNFICALKRREIIRVITFVGGRLRATPIKLAGGRAQGPSYVTQKNFNL